MPGLVRIAGAHNALGARLVERSGFDGVWSSSLEISASHLVPDADILTMSEFLAAAQSMAWAVRIPVVADCNAGYGSVNNVIHMVQKYEAAGVAAVCIEDKQYPKVNSFVSGRQELVSIDQFMAKIRAAKSARADADFMIIARVEAFIAGLGQEEALRRAHSYVEAGADVILIHNNKKTPQEIVDFIEAWDFSVPLAVIPTTYYAITTSELEALGVKLVVYANQGLRASIRAMTDTFAEILRTGTTASIEKKVTSITEILSLQGFSEFQQNERTYSVADSTRTRAILVSVSDPTKDHSANPDTLAASGSVPRMDGSFLSRQVDTMRLAGIRNITVAGVEAAQAITKKDLGSIDEWQRLIVAETGADLFADASSRMMHTLIVGSNILFASESLEILLKSPHDITLLVNTTRCWAIGGHRHLNLVKLGPPDFGSKGEESANLVLRIGEDVPASEADGEFVGLTLFSPRGFEMLCEGYKTVCNNPTSDNHWADPRAVVDLLTDVLQKLIDLGKQVHCIRISSRLTEVSTSKTIDPNSSWRANNLGINAVD